MASAVQIEDSQFWPQLRREAALDQAKRAGTSVFSFPVLLIAVAFTTHFAAQHPAIFWSLVGIAAISTPLRLAGTINRAAIYERSPGRLQWILGASIVTNGAATGLLYAYNEWTYGPNDWTFTVTMLFAIGISAGTVLSFQPNYRFLFIHTLWLFVPAIACGLWQGGTYGYTFAFGSTVMMSFILGSGYSLHRDYWRQLELRAREAAQRRELESAKLAAEASSLAKGQFLANMSHEIRTPMHGILGMAGLALQAETREETLEYVETIRNCGRSLLNILNDVLDFSKIEAGKMTVECIPYSPRQLATEARLVILPQAEAKGLYVEIRVADDVPEKVLGDPARLRQVLINLMGNATKFTERGGVRLEIERLSSPEGPRAGLHFKVIDSGIGIPPDKQKSIFEAFSQADGSVNRRFGGTGLGLTICARLAQIMEGAIWVESVPGAGSTFHFTCKAEAVGNELAGVNEAAGFNAVIPSMAILVADDNPINQKVARKMLSAGGHQVQVVGNGKLAVEAVEGGGFDLVLLDNQMPEMGGIEATQAIRALEESLGRRRVPIVALTASAMAGDRERFLSAGMDGYLAKPFSAEELTHLLRQFAPVQQK